MYIVQIRGANGSGKTSIVKNLLALSGKKELLLWEDERGKQKIFATVARDIEWAAIGNYPPDKPMGGCDNFDTMQDVKDAILDTFLTHPELFGIVFEGMMITAVKTPFYNFLLEMEQKYHIQPVFINLQATMDGCLRRIGERGTRRSASKPINLKLLQSKIDAVSAYGAFFGDYSKWIDVESTPKSKMLKSFLAEVGDKELVRQL